MWYPNAWLSWWFRTTLVKQSFCVSVSTSFFLFWALTARFGRLVAPISLPHSPEQTEIPGLPHVNFNKHQFCRKNTKSSILLHPRHLKFGIFFKASLLNLGYGMRHIILTSANMVKHFQRYIYQNNRPFGDEIPMTMQQIHHNKRLQIVVVFVTITLGKDP